jgi:hypothetical protein
MLALYMHEVSNKFGDEFKLPGSEPGFSSTQRFRLPIAKISMRESLTKNY